MQLPKYFEGPACRKGIGIARATSASTKGATRDPICTCQKKQTNKQANKQTNKQKNIGTAGIKASESPAC